jgi:hypothetical protein
MAATRLKQAHQVRVRELSGRIPSVAAGFGLSEFGGNQFDGGFRRPVVNKFTKVDRTLFGATELLEESETPIHYKTNEVFPNDISVHG